LLGGHYLGHFSPPGMGDFPVVWMIWQKEAYHFLLTKVSLSYEHSGKEDFVDLFIPKRFGMRLEGWQGTSRGLADPRWQ
jgi:hypothetical protein